MAIITKILEIIGAAPTTVDLSANTLGVGELQVDGTLLSQVGDFANFVGVIAGTATSVSISANWAGTAGNSISLVFNGSDTISAVISAWNIANPSNEATLTSGNGSQVPSAQSLPLAGGVDSGSSLIGDLADYVNFTPSSSTVAGALQGIDEALGAMAGGSQKVDKFTLDNTDITNKFVTLSSTPSPSGDTILIVEDAGNMFYGNDYTVTANQLSWDSLALDGILSSGDNLTVSYST